MRGTFNPRAVVKMSSETRSEATPDGFFAENFNPLEPAFFNDPGPLLERARRESPVFFSPVVNAWVITRFADVEAVLKDPAHFTSKDILSITELLSPEVAAYFGDSIPMEGTLIGVDAPEHSRLRGVLSRAFVPSRIAQLKDDVTDLVRHFVDEMKPFDHADLVDALCTPLPLSVIVRLIGFPDDEVPLFSKAVEDWTALSVAYLMGVPLEEQMVLAERIVDVHAKVLTALAERRRAPQEDLLTTIVDQQESEKLTDREMLSLIPGLILAGRETVSNVLAAGLFHLLKDRRRWEDLIARPETVENVVEEMLRLDGPVFGMWRNVVSDTDIAGVAIPGGSRVYLTFWSANVDETHYRGANEFIEARANKLHLAFGRGIHYCIGAPLARLQLRTTLSILADELPGLRLSDGFQPEFRPHFFLRGMATLPVEW